jgi:tetratricopeptide (TPR) repeat protein
MGDEGDIAQVLRNLGQLAQDEGDLDRADALLLECLALSRESGSNWGMISALSGLAFGAWFRGDYLRAKALMEECISLCREADDHRQTAGQLSYLALLARERGDYPRARALLEEALTLSRELNLGVQSGYALLGLGDVARDQVDHEAVERLCEESLTMFRTVNERPGMAWSLHNLGLAAFMRGDLRRARALCEESLSIMRDAFPDEFPTSEVLLGLGMIALGERNLDRARALLTNALGHARQHGPKWMVAAGLEGLAQVAAAEQQYDRAARFFGAADALRTRIGVPIRPFLVPRHERVLAEVYRALGQQAHARAWEAGRDVPLGEAVADALDESEDVQWRHAHDT